jgi:hypothetical protein
MDKAESDLSRGVHPHARKKWAENRARCTAELGASLINLRHDDPPDVRSRRRAMPTALHRSLKTLPVARQSGAPV